MTIQDQWNRLRGHRRAVSALVLLAMTLSGCGKTAQEFLIEARTAQTVAQQELLLSQALQKDPALDEARLWRARVYAYQRKTDAALADYDILIQRFLERRREVQEKLPRLEANVQRAQARRNRIRAALPPNETSNALRSAEADLQKAVGELTSAGQAIEATYKGVAMTYYRRGVALEITGQYEQAIESYSTALRNDDGLLNAYASRAEAFFKMGQYAGTMRDLAIVLERDIDRGSPAARERRGEWHLLRGFAAFCTGDWSSATAEFHAAIGDLPDAARRALAVLNLYYVACRTGDKAQSDQALLQYAEETLSPRAKSNQWIFSAVWYSAGLIQNEEAFLEASRHSDAQIQENRQAQAQYYIGARRRATGDLDKAAEAFKKCIEHKNVGLFEYHMAKVELERLQAGGRSAGDYVAMAQKVKDSARKIELYTEALRVDPNQTDARLNRAVLYSLAGEHDLAIDDYTRLLKIYQRPINLAMVLRHRAVAYAQKGLHREAVRDYTQAIAADPDLWQAREGLAIALCHLRQYEDAARVYGELVRDITGSGMLDFWRLEQAYALACAGVWDRAAERFRAAVARRDSSPVLHVNLLLAESKLGNRGKVMDGLKRRAATIKIAGWDASVLWHAAGTLSAGELLKACQHSDATEEALRTSRAYYYIGALSLAQERVDAAAGIDALKKCVVIGRKLSRESWEYRLALAELERLEKP